MTIIKQAPFFFKQIGSLYYHSGRHPLDGRIWDNMPLEVPRPAQEVQPCHASI